jgi:predicted membrane protein
MIIFEYLIIIFKLKIIYVYFTISYIKDKRMSENNERKDDHTYFEAEDISNVKKVWIVEWSSKFEKSSTNEISNYRQA